MKETTIEKTRLWCKNCDSDEEHTEREEHFFICKKCGNGRIIRIESR